MKLIIFLLFTLNISNCFNNDNSWMDNNYKDAIKLYDKGDIVNAKKALLKEYDSYKGHHIVDFYLGKISFFQGDFKNALNYFKLFDESKDDNFLARQWIIKTKYALAYDRNLLLEEIDSFLLYNPDNIEILLIKAKCFNEAGKIDKAISTYNHIIQLGNSIAISHKDLGEIYQKIGIEERMNYHNEMKNILFKKYNLVNKKGKNKK